MKQTNEWKAKWNSTPKKTLENSTFSLKLSSYLTLIINAWDCHYWKTWPLGFVMIKSNIRTILPKNTCEDSLNPLDPLPNPPPPPLLPSLYKPCCQVSKFLFSRIKNFKYWSLVSLNTLFKFIWEDHGPWLLILIISLCYLYVNFKLAVTIMWSEGNISSAILPLTVSKVSCSKVIVMK